MRNIKYFAVLPMLLLSSCGGENLGRKITPNEASQRLYEIERYDIESIPAFRLSCDVSINMNSGMMSYNGTGKLLLEANRYGEGHGKMQVNINGGGYNNINETIEGYTVKNYEGYRNVTYLKLTSNVYNTNQTGVFVNDQYFGDFANSRNSSFVYDYVDVMENPFYYGAMMYPNPEAFFELFSESSYSSGFDVSSQFFSNGTGSLAVKASVRRNGRQINYDDYGYDNDNELQSGELTVVYTNYVLTKLSLTETTTTGSKGTVKMDISYPQNLTFKLPSDWKRFIAYQ